MKKINVRLLRRIQKHILEEPRRFFMSGVFIYARNQKHWKRKTIGHSDTSPSPVMPPCKMAACIAGWANILTGHASEGLIHAAKILGLSYIPDGDRESLANRVFIAGYWPRPFWSRYKNARTTRGRARVAVDRIEHLIKTGE